MSYKVTEEVLDQARARAGSRNMLSAIAEIAHHDGVGWLPQAWYGEPGDPRERRTIAHRAKLTPRQVSRCQRTLQLLDELEVVYAKDPRKPRARFYVYRLIVGRLRDLPVDYERGLPEIEGPFWTVEELLLPMKERPTTGHFVPWSAAADLDGDGLAPPDILSGGRGGDAAGDDQTSAPPTTRHPRRSRPDIDVRSLEPSWTPPLDPALREPRAAAELREETQGVFVASYAGLGQADPAAAVEGPRESEVEQIGRGLRGWDKGSMSQVWPRAQQLPREAFLDVIGKLERRRPSNPPGLLVHLLDLAIAERAAAVAFATYGNVEQPMSALERVKRERPERVVDALGAKWDEHDLNDFLDECVPDEARRELCRTVWRHVRGLQASRDLASLVNGAGSPLWIAVGCAHPGWSTRAGREQWALEEGALLPADHAEAIVAEAMLERDDVDQDEAERLLALAATERDRIAADSEEQAA